MTETVTNRFLARIVPDKMTLCLSKERSLPDQGRPKLPFRNYFFSPKAKVALDTAVRKALAEQDTNNFFGIGGYDDAQRRKAVNVRAVKVLLLDVDIKPDPKYFNKKKQVVPALKKLHQACPDLPSPWIVDSGYGVHVYYELDKDLPTDLWSPIAALFASVVKAVEPKLIADPVRTRDTASVMRLPGSWNAKKRVRLPVKVSHEGGIGDTEAVKATLAAAASRFNVSGVEDVVGNELVPNLPALPAYMNVPADMEFGGGMSDPLREEFKDLKLRPILEGCRQMRELCQSKGNVEEPLWMLQLRVLNTVEKADDVAAAFSSGHPSYTEAGTRRKMRHIRTNFEAATAGCEEFKLLNKSSCYGCPNAGNVWTPSQLAVLHIQNEEVKAAETEALEIAESGVVTPQGYIPQYTTVKQAYDAGSGNEYTTLPVRQPGKKATLKTERAIDAHVNLVHSTAMVENTVVNHKDRPSTSDVRVHLDVVTRGETNRAVCTAKELTTTGYDAATDTLRSQGVVFEQSSLNQRHAINKYLQELVKLSGHKRKEFRPTKGWLRGGRRGDWSFVAGARHYLPDGTVVDNVTSAEHTGSERKNEGFMERNCSGYPVGQIDRWKRGMAIYDGANLRIPQLLLLSGLANMLLPLIPGAKGGIVLALTGGAGKGKTTLLEFMASMMGDHAKFVVPGSSTTNALEGLLQQANCMTLPVDDTLSEDAEQFSAMLSMVTGGAGKMRMLWDAKKGSSVPYEDGFHTSILLSSNKSTVAAIGTGGAGKSQLQTEAARSRTLEFPATKIRVPPNVSKADWSRAHSLVSSNYGHAANLFLRYVVANQVNISSALVRLETEVFERLSTTMPPDKAAQVRFWARFLAVCGVTASIVCNKLNLLNWNHLEILYAGEKMVAETVADAEASDDELIEDFWSVCVDEPNPNHPKINFVTRIGFERNMGHWKTAGRSTRMKQSEWSQGSILPGQANVVGVLMSAANEHNRWRVDAYDARDAHAKVLRRERTIFIPLQELKNMVRREAGKRLAVTDWSDLYIRLLAAGCVIEGVKPQQPDHFSRPTIRVKVGLRRDSPLGTSTSVVEIRLPPQTVS